ncbi:hypothetical protein ACN38_g13202, partial [Penicillium nordicum]
MLSLGGRVEQSPMHACMLFAICYLLFATIEQC